jgi:hypothetical protein
MPGHGDLETPAMESGKTGSTGKASANVEITDRNTQNF